MTKANECSGCGKEFEDLKKCSGCKSVKYCNRECQVRDWRMHKLACCPPSMGDNIDQDLAEFVDKWTEKWSGWDSSRDPYDMAEMEERVQKQIVSSSQWPSKHVIKQYMKTNWVSQIHRNYGIDDGVRYYNHTLGKELYNAAGVSDRVKLMVAFRRVGWKVKLHGESVAGMGNNEEIMRCMKVHYYLLEQIIQGGRPNPHNVPITTGLTQAWDGIGPWRA